MLPEPSSTRTIFTPSLTFSNGIRGSARPIIMNATATRIKMNEDAFVIEIEKIRTFDKLQITKF